MSSRLNHLLRPIPLTRKRHNSDSNTLIGTINTEEAAMAAVSLQEYRERVNRPLVGYGFGRTASWEGIFIDDEWTYTASSNVSASPTLPSSPQQSPYPVAPSSPTRPTSNSPVEPPVPHQSDAEEEEKSPSIQRSRMFFVSASPRCNSGVQPPGRRLSWMPFLDAVLGCRSWSPSAHKYWRRPICGDVDLCLCSRRPEVRRQSGQDSPKPSSPTVTSCHPWVVLECVGLSS